MFLVRVYDLMEIQAAFGWAVLVVPEHFKNMFLIIQECAPRTCSSPVPSKHLEP